MKISTWNVHHGREDVDIFNDVAAFLDDTATGILSLQEMGGHHYVLTHLDQERFGWLHDPSPASVYMNALVWRLDRWENVDRGHWGPWSDFEGITRWLTWATLRHTLADRLITVAAIHAPTNLSNAYPDNLAANQEMWTSLRRLTRAKAKVGHFVAAGDFNYGQQRDDGTDTDGPIYNAGLAGLTTNYQSLGQTPVPTYYTGAWIDYIMIRQSNEGVQDGTLTPVSQEVHDINADLDHNPLTVTYTLT